MPAKRDSNGRFIKGSGKGRASVTDTDKGYDALFERMRARAKQVTVGIHEDVGAIEHQGGGGTIAEVMARHELGLGVPRRSFIADWQDENEEQNKTRMRKIGQAVIAGTVESIEQGLDRFGLVAVGEVQLRIRAGIDPELAESTKARKGSDTPLIDTGEGWTSIKHKVGEQE